jgi:hypothetical protein
VVFAPKGWKGAVSPYYGKNNWWSEITRKSINGNVEKPLLRFAMFMVTNNMIHVNIFEDQKC